MFWIFPLVSLFVFECCLWADLWALRRLLRWFKPQNDFRRTGKIIAWAVNLLLALCLFRVFGWAGFRIVTFLLFVVAYGAMTVLAATAAAKLLARTKLASCPRRAAVGVFAAALLIFYVGGGLRNAYMPKVVRHDIGIAKNTGEPLRLMLLSDLHLGTFVGNGQLRKLRDIVARERPDIILIAGDLTDDGSEVLRREHMDEELRRITAPLGVYAVLGNHDDRREPRDTVPVFAGAGVRVLTDESLLVGGRLWLLGRRDASDRGRAETASLITPEIAASPLPVILLDHQPREAKGNLKLPIDLQLSGHTHDGQIFPGNIFVRIIHEYAYGHLVVEGKDLVVSAGYGLWGLPLRIGTRAEVVMIELHGDRPHRHISPPAGASRL